MVGNNHRKPRVTPTPCPLCRVSTFFLAKWKEDILEYTSYFQVLKMFHIGTFEDFLRPIFVSVSWNYHISKAMLFLRSSPLYYWKYCLIHFLLGGEVGCWFLKWARYSHALSYSVKIPIKRPLIYMHWKRLCRNLLGFQREHGEPDSNEHFVIRFRQSTAQCQITSYLSVYFYSKQICLIRHWQNFEFKTQPSPNPRLPV